MGLSALRQRQVTARTAEPIRFPIGDLGVEICRRCCPVIRSRIRSALDSGNDAGRASRADGNRELS